MTSESPWDLSSIVPLLMEFMHDRDWEQFHRPKELTAAIAIEAAELQELFLWRERESASEIKNDDERMRKILDEIADILIYTIYLANDMNINLKEAIFNKTNRNRERY